MWCWGKAFNKHGHVKIILKDTLKWVPVLGQGVPLHVPQDLTHSLPRVRHEVWGNRGVSHPLSITVSILRLGEFYRQPRSVHYNMHKPVLLLGH